jgi:hypothetical protein
VGRRGRRRGCWGSCEDCEGRDERVGLDCTVPLGVLGVGIGNWEIWMIWRDGKVLWNPNDGIMVSRCSRF